MLIYCPGCNETLTCSQRNILCDDCIEKDFEIATGQICQSKMDTTYPEIIVCPRCCAIMLLEACQTGS